MSLDKIKIVMQNKLDLQILDENGAFVPGVIGMVARFYPGGGAILEVERCITDESGNPISNSHQTDVLRELLEFRCSDVAIDAEKIIRVSDQEVAVT